MAPIQEDGGVGSDLTVKKRSKTTRQGPVNTTTGGVSKLSKAATPLHPSSRANKTVSGVVEGEVSLSNTAKNVIDSVPSGSYHSLSHPSHKSDSLIEQQQQKQQLDALQSDLNRRQESYIRRERAYKTRIDELEDSLRKAKEAKVSWMGNDRSMKDLKNMHKCIMSNVEIVQDRTANILQEQERDLLRAFRARLFDVQTELEKEKMRKGDGAGAWIERSRKLETELDWTSEVADRLDRMNQHLLKENGDLKAQYKIQQEDRNYLVKQLVAVKKDNTRLRQEVEGAKHQLKEKEEEIDCLQAKGALGGATKRISNDLVAAIGGAEGVQGRAEHYYHYQQMIRKLKRNLEIERRNSKTLREKLNSELQGRTELQTFIKAALDDVRAQIEGATGGKRLAQAGGASAATSLPGGLTTAAYREKALSLLLSQERVVALLYDRAFGEATIILDAESNSNIDQSRPLSAPFGQRRASKNSSIAQRAVDSRTRRPLSAALAIR